MKQKTPPRNAAGIRLVLGLVVLGLLLAFIAARYNRYLQAPTLKEASPLEPTRQR